VNDEQPPGRSAAAAVRASGSAAVNDVAAESREVPAPGEAATTAPGQPASGGPSDDLGRPEPRPGGEPPGDRDPAPPPGSARDTAVGPAPAADGSGPDPRRLRSAVEAILFVVDRPITEVDLAQVLDLPRAAVLAVLAELRADLDEQGRGFELRQVAGGWRFYTREEFAPDVERYVRDGQQARLTQAALETLAVVAYRQPVTRSRISAIRGVSVDGVIRTLLSRGLIEECGSEPETGGLLYRTTGLFLEKLGLLSLEELPSLAPLLPELESVEDVVPST
jgi:segregation and condensation protein B